MSLLEALILGLIQGITEFLPVSSSGHLALAEHFLGFTQLNQLVFFDLICHLGTLLAIATIFKKEIIDAFKNKKMFLWVIIGTLPLFPLALLIKPLKELFDRLDLIGFFFLFTAFLLWSGERFGKTKENKKLTPLYVGLFQALALLPGVSRSGSTISGARLIGLPMDKAVTFSFLLAIPAILGAFTLEAWSLYKQPIHSETLNIGLLPLALGFATSYGAGLCSLNFLIRYATKKNLLPFAWYCLILGFLTLIQFYA